MSDLVQQQTKLEKNRWNTTSLNVLHTGKTLASNSYDGLKPGTSQAVSTAVDKVGFCRSPTRQVTVNITKGQ